MCTPFPVMMELVMEWMGRMFALGETYLYDDNITQLIARNPNRVLTGADEIRVNTGSA